MGLDLYGMRYHRLEFTDKSYEWYIEILTVFTFTYSYEYLWAHFLQMQLKNVSNLKSRLCMFFRLWLTKVKHKFWFWIKSHAIRLEFLINFVQKLVVKKLQNELRKWRFNFWHWSMYLLSNLYCCIATVWAGITVK